MLILISCIISILIYWYVVRPLGFWRRKGVTHIKAWPIFGNFVKSTFQILSFSDELEKLYNECPNERYVGIHQFKNPVLMLRDPDLIKQIGITDFDKFRDHNVFSTEDVDPLWNKNLFSSKGDKWHALRTTLSPAFTGSKIRAIYIFMSETAKKFVSYFDQEGDVIEVGVKDAFSRFSSDVIGNVAFGVQCDSMRDRENDFFVRGRETTDISGLKALRVFGFLMTPFIMKLFSIKIFSDEIGNFFKGIIKESIEYRKKEGVMRPDMIHLLMEASKTDKYGVLKSEDDFAAQALIFFFAGFETISNGMTFLQYELAINPDIQEKLYQEVEEKLKECNGEITYDILMKMKYLDMVVSETLRKWPGNAFFDRLCTAEYLLEPKHPHEKPLLIEPGTILWVPNFALMRDPKHFPEPEKFIPERFAEDNKNNNLTAFLPFGLGPRNCIGMRFAIMEMKVVTVMLLHKYQIVPIKKTMIPMQLSERHFLPYPKGGEMWLGFKKRQVL